MTKTATVAGASALVKTNIKWCTTKLFKKHQVRKKGEGNKTHQEGDA